MKDLFQEVKQRINLLEYARKFLNIKQMAGKYMAICPFHAEKTPSFHIDHQKDLFYCFRWTGF